MASGIDERIQQMVKSDAVVLFMKGTRQGPQCGFSATVVGILDELLPSYTTVNVLEDPALRQGIKAFSDWPTIPQLYIRGEFVGGCDIIKEMYASGELYSSLGVEVPTPVQANITITDAAVPRLQEAMAGAQGASLRLSIDRGFRHDLFFGEAGPKDVVVESNGIAVRLDAGSSQRAEGLVLDFATEGLQSGFKITNPNEPKVRAVTVHELKEMLDNGDTLALFDVRPTDERAKASIDAARPLDNDGRAWIQDQPKDTVLVFHCHHGGRSQRAAESFVAEGYTRVYNLQGGVDLWAQEIDPSVPRY